MDNTTDLPGKQTPDGTTVAGGVKQQDAVQTRWRIVLPLWVLALAFRPANHHHSAESATPVLGEHSDRLGQYRG